MITGFPINYKFIGNHSKRCEHVGNAVPPQLSSAIAKQCVKFLDLQKEAKTNLERVDFNAYLKTLAPQEFNFRS